MMLKLALVVAGCSSLAAAQSEVPDTVEGTKIFQMKTGTQTTQINWFAPTLGTHEASILGYKLQMQEVCAVTVPVTDAETVTLQSAVTTAYGATGTFVDSSSSCSTNYVSTDAEPICVTVNGVCVPPSSSIFPVTQRNAWVDVTGVYTPSSGQNHDGQCLATCATNACSAYADGATCISSCSGCMPQNSETDVGCFPGAVGFPTAPNTFHDIGGLKPGKFYKFKVKAFNVFGQALAWSSESYAVHMHTTPNAPTWSTLAVTDASLDGTGLTLNWLAPDNFGRGTDECASSSDRTAAVTNLICASSDASLFDACDSDNDASISVAEAALCPCLSGSGTMGTVTITRERCSTQGTAAANTNSASSSGSVSYAIKMCKVTSPAVLCLPVHVPGTTTAGITPTSASLTGLSVGAKYMFTVTASNAAGSGVASSTTSFTTAAVPAAPTLAPTATAVGDTTLSVTWSHLLDLVPAGTRLGELTAGTYSAGFILYAQSCNSVGLAASPACDAADSAHWSPAARSSLTSDGEDTIAQSEYALGRASTNSNIDVSYEKDSDSTTLQTANGDRWLKLTHFTSQTYTVGTTATAYSASSSCSNSALTGKLCAVDTVGISYLAPGTKYRFLLKYVNAAGTSAASPASVPVQTLDSAVSSLRIYSGPPCVYKASLAAPKRKTTFAASATGTNVRYTWELVTEAQTGTSVLYSGSLADPGGSMVGTCMDSASVCSVMEYEIPNPGVDADAGMSNYDEIKIRVLAYNQRGIVTEELSFGYVDDDSDGTSTNDINTIEYCGCTDSTDPDYWSDATYMIPTLCTNTRSFTTTADVTTVNKDKWEYFQFFFDVDSYAAEVTLRVDVGEVDIYVGTEGVPDQAQAHTYSSSQAGVSSFYIAPVTYSDIAKSTTGSVYVAVKGVDVFSRIQVLGRTSDFMSATRVELEDQSVRPGTCSATDATNSVHVGLCSAVTLLASSTACAGVELMSASICTYTKTPLSSSIKTFSYEFYELFYPHADNDVDVVITVGTAVATAAGGVTLYASTSERYPSPSRATSTYSGYWTGTGHTGSVIAGTAGTVTSQSFTYTIRPHTNAGKDGTLYIGIMGKKPSGWTLGQELPSTAYTIAAKVFRYRIESALLEPGRPVGVTLNDAVGGTDTDEDRYSVVSSDNFNYYEIKVTKATFQVTCTFTVHYGTVEVFTSSSSLPTQDLSLQTNSVGTTIGQNEPYAAGGPYTMTISYNHMNIEKGYVYVGIIATSATEASYDIVVQEDTFGVKAPTDLYLCNENTDVGIAAAKTTVAIDAACTILPGCGTTTVADGCVQATLRRRVGALGGAGASGATDGASFTLSGQEITLTDSDASDSLKDSGAVSPTVMPGQIMGFVNKNAHACLQTHLTGEVLSTLSATITIVPGTDLSTVDVTKCNVVRRASVASTDQMTAKYYGDQRDGYHFFQMYIGPQDAAYESAARTSAGSLPSDISTDPDTWGLDWTTPFTQTWKDSKTDEWDLDVDIGLSGLSEISGVTDTGVDGTKAYQVFASSREKYPSLQRSWDETVISSSVADDGSLYSVVGSCEPGVDCRTTFSTETCTFLSQSASTSIGACIDDCDGVSSLGCNALVFDSANDECDLFICTAFTTIQAVDPQDTAYQRLLTTTDGTVAAASSMVLPTYTFSSSMVYFSVYMPADVNSLSGDFIVTQNDKNSGRVVSTDASNPPSRCTDSFCSAHGKCIDDPEDGEHFAAAYCVCDEGWTGASCSVGTEWGSTTGATIATTAKFTDTSGMVATGHTWLAATTAGTTLASCSAINICTLDSTEVNAAYALNGLTITLTDDTTAKSGTGTIIGYTAGRVATIEWTTAPTVQPDGFTEYSIAATCTTGNSMGDYAEAGSLVVGGTTTAVLASTSSKAYNAYISDPPYAFVATSPTGAAATGTITAMTTILTLDLTGGLLSIDQPDGALVTATAGSATGTLSGICTDSDTSCDVVVTAGDDAQWTGTVAVGGGAASGTIAGATHKASASPLVTIAWDTASTKTTAIAIMDLTGGQLSSTQAHGTPVTSASGALTGSLSGTCASTATSCNVAVATGTWTGQTGSVTVGSVTGIIAGVTLQATTYKLYKAGCATGDTWTDTTAADTCAPTANAPEWQPFVSVGDPHGASTGDTLVGSSCASVFYFGFAHDGVVAACKAACATTATCNAFTFDTSGSANTCTLFKCPLGFASPDTIQAGGAVNTYYQMPYACCASTSALSDTTCGNIITGVYDEATCETTVGTLNQAACEWVPHAYTPSLCATVANVPTKGACELSAYPEIPVGLCSPAAINAGITSCDAFEALPLDCSSQKCTPSAAGSNPYKVGYVTCPGGVCTINAPQPILTIPYSVKHLPTYAKVVTYVDSVPYPSKGANAINYVHHCETSDKACIAAGSTAAPPFVDSSVKIFDLKPLSSGKKHTLVLMLLTDSGEPLGTQVVKFDVGYGGGCAIAPDGKTCGGNGACYLGYCVCYDGWYGTSCTNSVQEDGSTCAAQTATSLASCTGASDSAKSFSCVWSTTTLPAPVATATDTAGICTANLAAVTGFKAGSVYETRVAQLTQSKLGEARFLNTRMLESTTATITKSNAAITAKTSSTNSKLQTHATTVQTSLTTDKAATQVKVDALYAKMERNAIVIQQAREESLRSQSTNLEAKLELKRALADHQTDVQNRFQTKRFGVYKLNALKQDKLKQEFARSRFTINQLKTANGPTVDTTKFKESTCTTDQFYNVKCTDTTVDKQSLYEGSGYVSAQTVPDSDTAPTAAPTVSVNGATLPGTYNDVNRG